MHRSTRLFLPAAAILAIVTFACCQLSSPQDVMSAVSSIPGGEADSSGWIAFERSAEGFRVDLPSTPTTSMDEVSSIVGPQKVVRYGGSAAGVRYEVGYLIRTRNPLARLASDSRILDAAASGTLEHFRAREVESGEDEFDGLPARWMTIVAVEDGETSSGRLLIILGPQRIYHVFASGVDSADGSSAETVERIFSSYRLTHSEK